MLSQVVLTSDICPTLQSMCFKWLTTNFSYSGIFSAVCLPDKAGLLEKKVFCQPRFNARFKYRLPKSELKHLYLPALQNENKMLPVVFAANPYLLLQVSMLCCPVQVPAFPAQQPSLLETVWIAYTGSTL
jgi:hypothetical protein